MPLGVQLHNENKLTEMTQILLALNKYVPADHTEQTIELDETTFTEPETKVWRRMLYGDQLTIARVRGAAALHSLHKTKLDRLEGYVPATSDWHTRLCLVTVSYPQVYNFYLYYANVYRFCKTDFIQPHHLVTKEHCFI